MVTTKCKLYMDKASRRRTSIIMLLMLTFGIDAECQTLKNYSGKFENGTANYQYYDSPQMDRIIHGSFSYIGSLFDMKGNYVNGKKNGKWEITANEKLFSGWRGSIKLNTKISGLYNNGKLEGSWTYSNSIRFANDKDEDKEVSSATFYNNHFIGKVTYQASWPITYTANCEFDSSGFLTGTSVYKKGDERDEIKFMRGVAYWRLYNNTTNGEKKLFCDSTVFVESFWKAFDPNTNTSTVNGKTYYPDTVEISSEDRVPDSRVVKIEDPFNPVDRSFNPICIWMNESISVFEAGGLTNPLYYYSVGSEAPKGFQIIIRECNYSSECYQNLLKAQAEQKRKEQEKIRLEKERLAAIERKQKYDATVENGNKLFEQKKFKKALAEYNSANAIEFSTDLSDKIKTTQSEIDKIEKLQKSRYDTYSYIKSKTETINTEMASLKVSLDDKKKVYGKNYEACMNLLSANFASYFSSVTALFNTNKTNGLTIEESWNDTDQDALDLLLKFKDELKPYEKFHNAVKTAFDTDNKDQLKLLKVSDDPKEIISKF